MRRVLLTGAVGALGGFLARHLARRYAMLFTDRRDPERRLPRQHGTVPFILADITDYDSVHALCEGIDTVLHFAANGNPMAPMERLLPHNIIGAQHVFRAAHAQGCRRVIFASSVQAALAHDGTLPIDTTSPRPCSLYGATKAWGEAVASYYADRHGVSCLCLRIGWAMPRDSMAFRHPENHGLFDHAITYEDLLRLVVAAIEAPDALRFGIYYGLSNNRISRFDISATRAELGYAPQDDAYALAGDALTGDGHAA